MKFYGLDWLAMSFHFIGMYLLTKKNKKGFLLFCTGNLLWICFAFMVDSLAQGISNAIIAGLNIKGFINWKEGK